MSEENLSVAAVVSTAAVSPGDSHWSDNHLHQEKISTSIGFKDLFIIITPNLMEKLGLTYLKFTKWGSPPNYLIP